MSVERSRIALLAGLAALCLPGGLVTRAWAERLPAVTVYRSPT